MLAAVTAACDCVMCIGHNKGWEEAASELSGESVALETANAAVLEARGGADVAWADALSAAGAAWDLRGVLTPA